MDQDSPYKDYMHTRLWDVISCVIADLDSNDDIELNKPQDYVVGYICREVDAYIRNYCR